MTFGVFIHRPDSIYDDSPAERYQFPPNYLGRVRACLNDWIIYYEPTKSAETRGYFAVAKVQQVVPDTNAPGMYIAVIEPGSYLDFAALVPFNGPEGLAELGLLNENGRLSGRAQSAVRPLATTDFNRIIRLGLAESDGTLPRLGAPTQGRGFSEIQDPFASDANCDRVSQLVSRLVRDRVFRKAVLRAYDSRCAVTGLRLINGGGRAEVQAAHIKPVEASGPDTIGNGLALSGTVHWMFDRGLISVSNDWKIMVSRHLNDADNIRSIMNKSGYLLLPLRESDRPRPAFIQWHQQHCFKG